MHFDPILTTYISNLNIQPEGIRLKEVVCISYITMISLSSHPNNKEFIDVFVIFMFSQGYLLNSLGSEIG